jgi:hypothetical protein
MAEGDMRKVCSSVLVLFSTALFISGAASAAQQATINGITLSDGRTRAGTNIVATVTGTSGVCGAVEINWGDGATVTYPTSSLPVRQSHVYETAGTFSVRARGIANCSGDAATQIVIVEAPSRAPAPRLTSLVVPAGPIEPGTATSIGLEGSGACAVRVTFGDGGSVELNATLPTSVRHTYQTTGRYTVMVAPEPPCTETRSATVEVARPADRTQASGKISGIDLPATARLGDPVTITINGTGSCRIVVDFDNGEERAVTERLPYKFTYTFKDIGPHEIFVWTDEPCSGSAEKVVRVRGR